MTGYQSKRNMAQNKLTIDRTQVEHWLQSLKDIDALHHPAEPESADAQKAIADMGQVLEQPAQEPVAWMFQSGDKFGWRDEIQFEKPPNHPVFRNVVALLPQRKPLTDEQIDALWQEWKDAVCLDHKTWAKAIEAAHGIKEKNT
jgi:hypothetical protein